MLDSICNGQPKRPLKLTAIAAFCALLAASLAPPVKASEAAEALVEQFGITTYNVSKIDDNIYEIASKGVVVVTEYCYAIGFGEVAVTEQKIIFIDDDEVCDVQGIYRR